MAARTRTIRGERYIIYERSGFSPWHIGIKKDGNEAAYDASFRTGWEDGGEVELFTLMPKNSDSILLQLRISTKAIKNDNVPPVPHPAVAVQCSVPAFVFIEQERSRVLIQFMCRLSLKEPHTLRVAVDPEIDFLFE